MLDHRPWFTTAHQEWNALSKAEKRKRKSKQHPKSLAQWLGLLGADENAERCQLRRIRLVALSGPGILCSPCSLASSYRKCPFTDGDGNLSHFSCSCVLATGAVPIYNTSTDFLAADLRTRTRLAAIGTLLSRVPVRPSLHCASQWAVGMTRSAGGIEHMLDEAFPAIGIKIATCKHLNRSGPGNADACCSATYGKNLHAALVACMPSVHPAFLEYTLADMTASGKQIPLEVRLDELPKTIDGALDASPLLRFISERDREALSTPPAGVGSKVLLIRLEEGEELPALGNAQPWVGSRTRMLMSGSCKGFTALISQEPAKNSDRKASREALLRDIQVLMHSVACFEAPGSCL